jgi:hypothetical protein
MGSQASKTKALVSSAAATVVKQGTRSVNTGIRRGTRGRRRVPTVRIVLTSGGAVRQGRVGRKVKLNARTIANERADAASEYLAVALGSRAWAAKEERRKKDESSDRDSGLFVTGSTLRGFVEVSIPRDRLPSSATPTDKFSLAQDAIMDQIEAVSCGFLCETVVNVPRKDSRVEFPLRTNEILFDKSENGAFRDVQRRTDHGVSSEALLARLPFSFFIPAASALPPSTKFAAGQVTYALLAQVQFERSIFSKSEAVGGKLVTVVPGPKDFAIRRDELNHCDPAWGEGSMKLDMLRISELRARCDIPDPVVTVGKRVDGTLTVTLLNTVDKVSDIQASVVMLRTLESGRHIKTTKKTVASDRISVVDRDFFALTDDVQFKQSGSDEDRQARVSFSLRLPSAIVPEFSTPGISLSHAVRVEIFTTASEEPCKIDVPIHILNEEYMNVEDLDVSSLDGISPSSAVDDSSDASLDVAHGRVEQQKLRSSSGIQGPSIMTAARDRFRIKKDRRNADDLAGDSVSHLASAESIILPPAVVEVTEVPHPQATTNASEGSLPSAETTKEDVNVSPETDTDTYAGSKWTQQVMAGYEMTKLNPSRLGQQASAGRSALREAFKNRPSIQSKIDMLRKRSIKPPGQVGKASTLLLRNAKPTKPVFSRPTPGLSSSKIASSRPTRVVGSGSSEPGSDSEQLRSDMLGQFGDSRKLDVLERHTAQRQSQIDVQEAKEILFRLGGQKSRQSAFDVIAPLMEQEALEEMDNFIR